MFESILEQLNGDYVQSGFSLKSFITTAKERSNEHIVIKNSIKEINQSNFNVENFNRNDLVQAYRNAELSSSTIFLLTFWWGHMSHRTQAPKFYTQDNLDKLNEIAPYLNRDLKVLYNAGMLEAYKDQLSNIYKKLKVSEYKLAGINTAFFTKILQFSYEAYSKKPDRYPFPIIADKWTKKAIYADLINLNEHQLKEKIFRKGLSNALEPIFKGSPNSEFDKYWLFINYFFDRTNQLRKNDKTLVTPFELEGIIFGWARDMSNPENPRVIAHKIIAQYFRKNY
jgi:hypothetical protein